MQKGSTTSFAKSSPQCPLCTFSEMSSHCLLFLLQDGSTPLFTASEKGYTKVVECLLKHGAKVNEGRHVSVTQFMMCGDTTCERYIILLVLWFHCIHTAWKQILSPYHFVTTLCSGGSAITPQSSNLHSLTIFVLHAVSLPHAACITVYAMLVPSLSQGY